MQGARHSMGTCTHAQARRRRAHCGKRTQAGMHAPATFMRSHQRGCARTHTGSCIGVPGGRRRLSCPAAFGSNAFMNAMNQSIDRFGSLCCMLHATHPVVWVCSSFRCASMRSTRSGAGSKCTHLLRTPLPQSARIQARTERPTHTHTGTRRSSGSRSTSSTSDGCYRTKRPRCMQHTTQPDNQDNVQSAIAQGGCRFTSVA